MKSVVELAKEIEDETERISKEYKEKKLYLEGIGITTPFNVLDSKLENKDQYYWEVYRVLNENMNERISKIDPSIFPDNLFEK